MYGALKDLEHPKQSWKTRIKLENSQHLTCHEATLIESVWYWRKFSMQINGIKQSWNRINIVSWFLTKTKAIWWGKKIFSIIISQISINLRKKLNLDLCLTPYIKTNLKQVKDLNIKHLSNQRVGKSSKEKNIYLKKIS